MGLVDNWSYTNFHSLNLDWILQEMKRTAEKVDGLLDDVEAIVKAAEDRIDAKVEAKIAEAMGEINRVIGDFQDRINAQIAENLEKMRELEGKVDGVLVQVDDKLAAQAAQNEATLLKFQTEINQQIGVLKDEIRRYDVELKRYIEQRFKELINMIPDVTMVWIHNPLTGKAQPVEDVIEFCNNYWLSEGFPVEVFDSLGMPVDTYHPEVWEFDTNGYERFHGPALTGAMPLHGRGRYWDDVVELDRRTANFGCEVQEFDALGYTVDELDAMEISVGRFDMWGFWKPAVLSENDGRYVGHVEISDGYMGVNISGIAKPAGDSDRVDDWYLLCRIGRSNYADGYVKTLYDGRQLLQVYDGLLVCADSGDFHVEPVEPNKLVDYHVGVLARDKHLYLVSDCKDEAPFSFFWGYREGLTWIDNM